jgi:hypothetical protein
LQEARNQFSLAVFIQKIHYNRFTGALRASQLLPRDRRINRLFPVLAMDREFEALSD